MSRFGELSNSRGQYSWRSHSQPPLSDFSSIAAEQGSPTFLNTESNQQIDDASSGDFINDTDARSTVVVGQITGVRTLSTSTLAQVGGGRQRQVMSGLTTVSSSLGHRPRMSSRNGRNDTPCRSFRSAFNHHPVSDTAVVVSSSSSNNSIVGRYRSISGTDGTEIGVNVQLQQNPLPHILRFASLRLDTMNTNVNNSDTNGPVRELTVLLDRPASDDDIEEDAENMHIPSLVGDEVSNYCGEFPAISCSDSTSNLLTSDIRDHFAVPQLVHLERQSVDGGSVFHCNYDAQSSAITPESIVGEASGLPLEQQPVHDTPASQPCQECEPAQTAVNTELGARNPSYTCYPAMSQPLIRFPNRRQSSSKTTSVKNPSQEPEADHDFICTSNLTTLPHRCDAHSQRLLTGLDQLRRTGYFCDVVLEVEGTKLPAHRNVLASCSQYFYAMFTGGMSEAASPYVQIQGMEADTLAKLLDFIYTGEVCVGEDTVETLLSAANLLQLISVRDACCEFLQSQLHPSNCLGIQRFADMHNCAELLNVSRRYAEQHFGELLEQDEEFLALPADQVLLLISSDRLAVSEVQVFEAVLRWIDHDPQTRQSEARVLCGRVRFSLLPRDYLVQLSQSERFLSANPWCKDYLIEALSYHLLSWDQKLRITSERAKPRTPVGLPKVLLVMGGQAPKAIRSVEYLEFRTGVWHCSKASSNKEPHQPPASQQFLGSRPAADLSPADINDDNPSAVAAAGALRSPPPASSLSQSGIIPEGQHHPEHHSPASSPGGDQLLSLFEAGSRSGDALLRPSTVVDLPSRRCRFGVAVVGGLVYVVGGFNGALRVRSVEVYDPIRNTWHSGPNMECRRATLGVAVLSGHIYAVGGFDGSSGLNSAEVFDFWSDSWRLIAPLSCRRSSVGAAVLNGMVYAVGGYDGVSRRCLSSVECYDPASNTWNPAAELTCRRSGPAVCELNDRIYAVGGHDGPIVRNTAEVYSPKSNTWQRIADLNVPRRNAGVVVYDGCLYVVGGEDGETNLSSVEKYDVASNTWVLLPSLMNIGRSYAGCTVIERTML